MVLHLNSRILEFISLETINIIFLQMSKHLNRSGESVLPKGNKAHELLQNWRQILLLQTSW